MGKKHNIKPLTPNLKLLVELLNMYAAKSINVPNNFKDRVVCIESLLDSDKSGLINTLLDFKINSGLVNFSVESSNKNVSKFLNDWLNTVNSDLRGKLPVGIRNLAKEYYRERWKGSSFLLLRTLWEKKEGYLLPTKLWFVDGKDIEIFTEESKERIIGNDSYGLYIDEKQILDLPAMTNEKIFVQKPYEKWDSIEPTPFLIRRGAYYNAKYLELILDKGANIVNKALDYMLLMKKGNAELAKLNNPAFMYDENEMTQLAEEFNKKITESKTKTGTPTMTSMFDTEIEEIIPDYKRVLEGAVTNGAERRILASLGFIEVIEGITSSRKESILNPKCFVEEVQSGISDFKDLLNDLLMTIIEVNQPTHKKFANTKFLQIRSTPVKHFFTKDLKLFMRSVYDRGLLSKRTFTELGLDIDFDSEIEIRKQEKSDGLEDLMYPPIIQNLEQNDNNTPQSSKPNKNDPNRDNVPDAKKGPEKKNFTRNRKE